MNQTIFYVPDPLVMHVLLLTHESMHNNICLPHSWYPQCDRACFFMCPNLTDDSPSLIYCGRLVLADAWSLTDFIQCHSVSNSAVLFFPFPSFFLGATSLMLQQQLSQFSHILHTQPSSQTFITDGLPCRVCNPVTCLMPSASYFQLP